MNEVNVPILIVAVIYIFFMNKYFGNNWLPQSNAEVICDGIGAMIIALAFLK